MPLPQAQATRWFRQHPGAVVGLYMAGTSGLPKGDHLDVLGFRVEDTAAFHDADVTVAVAAGGAQEALVRIAASARWLDPTPLPDDATGERLRVTVAGGCPASPGQAVGVRNEGPALSDALVPTGTPTAGLVCEYGHAAPHRFAPVVVHRLDAAEAAHQAAQLRALPLAHPPADDIQPHSCGQGLSMPTPTRIVVLAYPGRPDVDVWATTPCGGPWTANGWVGATL